MSGRCNRQERDQEVLLHKTKKATALRPSPLIEGDCYCCPPVGDGAADASTSVVKKPIIISSHV